MPARDGACRRAHLRTPGRFIPMRSEAVAHLACPACRGGLAVDALSERSVPVAPEFRERWRAQSAAESWTDVDEGFLRCDACRLVFPLHERVPRLFLWVLDA